MNQVIVLTHDQPVHQTPGIDPGVVPPIPGREGAVRQVIEEQPKGHSNHQGWGEPDIEDEINEAIFNSSEHNREEDSPP